MRTAVLVALLVTSAALMAGCSGKKEDDDHAFTCPDGSTLDLEKFPDHHNATFNAVSHCPHASGSATNTTSLAPNVLPILKLKVTDGKNETNVTMVGGNLTFDASGSSDSDGQVTGIAVTVQDSNNTRTAALFDPAKKTFKSATFKFDRPGIVNVTVAMVDDRAGFTVNQTHIYVDEVQHPTPQAIEVPGGDKVGTPCGGTTNNALADASSFKTFSFNLVAGATWVEATSDPDTAVMTICGPDDASQEGRQNEPMGDQGTGSATTTKGQALPPAVGIGSYDVAVYGGDAHTSYALTITVHYEPDTRSG